MNIQWNIRRANGLSISSYAFASVQKLVEDIRETGKADILVRHNTKTSLSVTISSTKDAGQSFHVGYIPAGAEKFKFHAATTTGIFDNVPRTRHYFKLSKTQGLAQLKEYLSLVLDELVPGMESLSIDMTLYKLPEICDFEIERANEQQ